MRVDGQATPLNMTNEVYSTRTPEAGGFSTIYAVNRNTGKLTVATTYQGAIALKVDGSCEPATPPATKF